MDKKGALKAANSGNGVVPSPSQACLLHLICGLGLAAAFWVAHNVYTSDLITNTSQTLRLILVMEAPVVILLYSIFRQNPNQCSYLKALGRGMVGLPAGAFVNALGAIALGAPAGIQYFTKTLNWSLFMSVLTFVPAASVFGSSFSDWQRVFVHMKPITSIDYMICIPAHGAVIGAWLGAWPMPLDWERPWQEWPICISYGAIAGYLVATLASFGFVLLRGGHLHVKGD